MRRARSSYGLQMHLLVGQRQGRLPVGSGPVVGASVGYAAQRVLMFPPADDRPHYVVRSQRGHDCQLSQPALHRFNPRATSSAVRALAAGWREDPGTLPLLRERVSTDPAERVRQVVVQALAAGWGEDARRRAGVSAGDDGMLESGLGPGSRR